MVNLNSRQFVDGKWLCVGSIIYPQAKCDNNMKLANPPQIYYSAEI